VGSAQPLVGLSVRQPGCLVPSETRGFAPHSHERFAFGVRKLALLSVAVSARPAVARSHLDG